ncbi:mitochondrial protein [Suhomyces tanzawaensis NRRL Y-17324]|uniref:SURF1-like protein n=1 Tax=Suhomyces tanzawaensis NRRL Y-17324 TaxID=984487 RepID=A0A1E4SIC1_9ASCO|nr:mitochondrial protein [Suhomyces tanzawaensis NRRL Y-17324]ODV79187.1 mitochondrial protein [Suhomyces tanzawaensis NRRL Y-17324]
MLQLFGRPFGHSLRGTSPKSVKTSTVDWKPLKGVQGNLATLEHQAKASKFRGFIFGLMIGMPIISFGLGCWQVQRLNWKVEVIARSENALAQPPIEELPANLDPSVIPEFEYRRFKVKGEFDYSQEMFLGPRMRNGILGYLVVTPFKRSSGGKPILVERGWINKDKVIPSTREKGYLSHLALPQGEIEIEALFRVMPTKSSLQFEHKDGSRLFNVHDVPVMAAQAGALPIYCQMIYDLRDHVEWRKDSKSTSGSSWMSWLSKPQSGNKKDDAHFIADMADDDLTLEYQEFEFVNEGVPIAAYPKIKLTNNHLQYLITWFGLSIASAGLLGYTFLKKGSHLSAEKVLEAKRKDMGRRF